MAIIVKVGDLVPLDGMRSGMTDKGLWCMVPVLDEKNSHNRTTLWAENAEETSKMQGKAKVKTIVSVKNGARKDKNGEWQKDISATAIFERPSDADLYATGSFAQAAFSTDPVKDSELPFNDMPFN